MSAKRKGMRNFIRKQWRLLGTATLAGGAMIGGGLYWGSPPTPPPTAADAAEADRILLVRIPDQHRGTIRTWVDFFRCYGLRNDDAVIVWTLRRAARNASGKLDFSPQRQIEVVLLSKDDAQIDSSDPFYESIKQIQSQAKQGQCGSGGSR